MMTIEKLYRNLSNFLDRLDDAAVLDDAVRELEILVARLRIRMLTGAYEPQRIVSPGMNCDIEKLLQSAEVAGQNPARERECCKLLIMELVMNTRKVLSKEGMPF